MTMTEVLARPDTRAGGGSEVPRLLSGDGPFRGRHSAVDPSVRVLPTSRFVMVVVALLGAGLLGLLLINTELNQGSFTVTALQRQMTNLSDIQEGLNGQLASNQAPGILAAHAQSMGMVPAGPPVFLRIPDGKVFGTPVPATAPPKPAASSSPSASPSPSAKPTASPTASPTAKPTMKPTSKPTATPPSKPAAKPSVKATTKPSTKPAGSTR